MTGLKNDDLKQVVGERIVHKKIPLDGNNFKNCVIENCVLEFAGNAAFGFEDCHVTDSQWTVVGVAGLTIEMLAKIAQMPGMQMFTEQVIAHIRGEGLASMSPELNA